MHRQQIEQRQQAFRDGQLQLNQLNREIEQNKSAVLDLMRKLAQVNSRLGAIEIERRKHRRCSSSDWMAVGKLCWASSKRCGKKPGSLN